MEDVVVATPTAEQQNLPQNERLKPYQDSPTQVISEKIQPFNEKLNKVVVKAVTKDHSQDQGYEKKIVDNPHHEGLVEVTETWSNGRRIVRSYDERYKPTDSFDHHKPGEFEVYIEDKSNYSFYNWSADLVLNPDDGSISQEITCTTEGATSPSYEGTLIENDRFFDYVEMGPMKEITTIKPNGETHRWRKWSQDNKLISQRPDVYQSTEVEDRDGVIYKGSVSHGVALGINIPMEVVYNAGKK